MTDICSNEPSHLCLRRFITTNYDCLLEQRAATSESILRYRLATHRNLAELADIQKAGADNFIFKLHGDINDAQNIILSESAYKKLVGDEDHPARRALSTIFASRPILFLGYSLGDPDLLLVLASLRETYEGNAGQRWALLPDPTPADIERLWKLYRIRVVPYRTSIDNVYVGHAEFIRILRDLGEAKSKLGLLKPKAESEQILISMSGALRHAAGFLQTASASSLSLHARLPYPMMNDPIFSEAKGLSGHSVVEIIEKSHSDIIIEGASGSGKSHSLKAAARSLSMRLIQTVQLGQTNPRCMIPIYVPMQAYTGNMSELIQDLIPAGLDLGQLSKHFTVVVMLDSVDETPTEHLHDRSWLEQLDQIKSYCQNERWLGSFEHISVTL